MKRFRFFTVVLFILPCSVLLAQKDESKDYAKIKEELNDKIFGTPDPYFKDNTLPEQYKNESAVILAQKHSIESDSRYKFRVFGHSGVKYNFFDIFRKKLLINDQSSLDEYSQLSFTKLQSKSWSIIGKLKNYTFINIRVIKPGGAVKSVNVDESAVTIKDDKDEKKNKIAIPDLAIGDIIDYYVANYYQEDDDASTTPLTYALGDDYPVINYVISLQFDGRIAAEYQAINGAPDFKISPDADGNGHILNMLVKNVPKIKGLIWSSPYRQLPIIRLNYKRGKIIRQGMTPINEGQVLKSTNRYPDLVEENMASIINQIFLDGASGTRMYYGTRGNVKKAWKEYVEKHPKADKPDSIAAFVFRYLNWSDSYGSFELQKNYDNAYYPLDLREQLYRIAKFGYILKNDFKTDVDVMIICAKTSYARNNLFSLADLSLLVGVNGTNTQYFSFADNFDFQNTIPYYLEGQEAKVYPLDTKRNYVTVAQKESRVTTLPTTDYKANHESETILAKLDAANLQQVTVKRKVNATGYLKKDAQAYLTIYEEMAQQTGAAVGVIDDLITQNNNKGRNAKKTEDELKSLLEKARTKHKEDFEKEIQRNYDNKAKELKSYKINSFGVTTADSPFEFEEEFDMEGWVKKAGNNYIVDIGKLIAGQLEIKKEQRERTKDIYMPFPRSFSYHIEFDIPEGYAAEGIDKLNLKSENETGAFISTAKREANKLIVDVNKYYVSSFEPAAKWPSLLSFIDKANEFNQQKILFKKQ
jgi:hypothetical protein